MFESDVERYRAIVQGREAPPPLPAGERGRIAAVIELSNKRGINLAEGFGDVDLVVAKSVARRYGCALVVECVYLQLTRDAVIGWCTTRTPCVSCRKTRSRRGYARR